MTADANEPSEAACDAAELVLIEMLHRLQVSVPAHRAREWTRSILQAGALRAAASVRPAGDGRVPDGCVVVPRDMTPEMEEIATRVALWPVRARRLWADLLAAAPPRAGTEGGADG